MEIVGYTHSDGYVLCDEHGDDGDGYQAPIFDDSEWDSFPTCDECGIPLDVTLTSDGFEYYHAMGIEGDTSNELYQRELDMWEWNKEQKR